MFVFERYYAIIIPPPPPPQKQPQCVRDDLTEWYLTEWKISSILSSSRRISTSSGSQSATVFYKPQRLDILIAWQFPFSFFFFFFAVYKTVGRRERKEIRIVNATKAICIQAPVALQDVKNDGVPLDNSTRDVVYWSRKISQRIKLASEFDAIYRWISNRHTRAASPKIF